MGDILEFYKPDVLIIDNLLDLIPKFMDQESYQEIKDLMALSTKYECCILSVMHTNKASFDDNMPGMAGTAAARKAEFVMKCQMENGIVAVTTADCRHAPIPTWNFRIGENGAIEPISFEELKAIRQQQMTGNEARLTRAYELANEMKNSEGLLERKTFKEHLKSELQIGETTVKDLLNQLIKEYEIQQEGSRGSMLRL